MLRDILAFLAIISMALNLPTFFMWPRILIAYLQAPKSKGVLRTFIAKEKSNVAKKIRFFLGTTIIPASTLAAGISLSILRIHQLNQPVSIILAIPFFIGCLALIPCVLLLPYTYLFEFYVLGVLGKRRLYPYLVALFFSLSLPYAASIYVDQGRLIDHPPDFAASQYGIFPIDSEETRLKVATSNGLYDYAYPLSQINLRIVHVNSPCNKLLEKFNLRMSSETGNNFPTAMIYKKYSMMAEEDQRDLSIIMVQDRFIRGFTFGISDAYSCTFSDIVPNYEFKGMATFLLIYQWIVSIFAVGLSFYPLKLLWDKVSALILKSRNGENLSEYS